jgi:carboxyl-terminal processing protease
MKWKKLREIGLGVCIGALVAWTFMAQANDTNNLRQILPFEAKSLWLMKQARAILETYHVDGDTPLSEDVLVQGALRGMVSAWDDPYTRYVDPDQLKEEEIDMEGEYGGLGIYIGRREGRTVVISPIEDTPADRIGLKPGDVIVKIGEENIADWDQNRVVKTLRGAPGTPVTVWIFREGESDLLRFDIVREKIEIKAVRYELLSGDVGYGSLISTKNLRRKSLMPSGISRAREPGGIFWISGTTPEGCSRRRWIFRTCFWTRGSSWGCGAGWPGRTKKFTPNGALSPGIL